MSDDVGASTSGGHTDDRPPGWRLTRRAFLAGCAAVAGAAAVAGKLVAMKITALNPFTARS